MILFMLRYKLLNFLLLGFGLVVLIGMMVLLFMVIGVFLIIGEMILGYLVESYLKVVGIFILMWCLSINFSLDRLGSLFVVI